MGDATLRQLGAAAVACLAVACTRTHAVALAQKPYPLATVTTVSASGVPVGTLSLEHPQFDLTVTRSILSRDGLPDLRFETETPCGPRTIEGSLAVDNNDVLSFGANIYETLQFWYDNRDGGLVRLSIGALNVSLPEGRAGDFRVLFAGCTGSIPVKVNGAAAGEITLDEHARERGFVVDPSGRRCYRGRSGTYSNSGVSGGSPPETFSGKQLYEWVPVTDFLRAPASTITAPSIVQVINVSAWQEVECAK